MNRTGKILLLFVLAVVTISTSSCGGKSTPTQPPIDPSGNWNMKFTDANGQSINLSALFSQTGSTVTAFNVLAAGNAAPFSCVPFSATFANGQVLNVNQFSGDIQSQFGNIHFASTLNDAGSHADGTFTLTGSCWGIGATGTFSADEVPSVSGSWSGTINCVASCPVGATTGSITATLTQNDTTGQISGTYAVTGLPNISSGTVSSGQFDVLSGFNLQATFTDNDSNNFTLAGGPFSGTTAGLATNRSFNGNLFLVGATQTQYSVSMTH
ncbi:MAG TPA: hypothetical protein VJW20_20455 [Candidatus Angelobacter sp.]|nr:hypothetical protein [Candidatus Angelobacter sp.]